MGRKRKQEDRERIEMMIGGNWGKLGTNHKSRTEREVVGGSNSRSSRSSGIVVVS